MAKCEHSLQSEISQLQINESTKLLNTHLQRLYLQGDELERMHRAEAHLARMLRQKLLLYLELQSFRHLRAESEDIVEPCIVTLREPAIRNRLKAGRRQLLRTSESQSIPVG